MTQALARSQPRWEGPVPFAQGARRVRTLESGGGVTVMDAIYPAGVQIGAHEHASAGLAVVLAGTLETSLSGGRRFSSPRGSVIVLPAGLVHSHPAPATETRLIAIEVDLAALAGRLGACAKLFGEARQWRDHRALALAWSIARELAAPDAMTPLLSGGMAVEVLAAADRLIGSPRERSRPCWLMESVEAIHLRYAEPLRLHDRAREAGVHPVYFSRAFHKHMGCTVRAYVRNLRVDRAADLLASSELSIAEVALEAGFSDQSHLCNVFRRVRGVTPSRYRVLARQQPG